jgi:hypothetical protein
MNNSLSYMPQINLSGATSSGNVPPISAFASSAGASRTLAGSDAVSSSNVASSAESVDLRKHPSGIVPVLQ